MEKTLKELLIEEREYIRRFSNPRTQKSISQLIYRGTYIPPDKDDELVKDMKEVNFFFYDELMEKFGVSMNFIKHVRNRYKLPIIRGECIKKHQNVLKRQGLRKCPICGEVKDLETGFYKTSLYRCLDCEKLKHKETYFEKSTRHLTSLNSFLEKKLKESQNRFKKLKLRNDKMQHTLTLSELIELYGKQHGKCFYTGRQLEVALSSTTNNSLSIDRLDSDRGYTLDNVVLCCGIVNTMKMHHTFEDFKTICVEVSQNFTPQSEPLPV